MIRKWMKQSMIGAIPFVAIMVAMEYKTVKTHTFILSGDDKVKSEQIQPINECIKVTSTTDTDVVFTDIETGETHVISYISSGSSEIIQLEKEKWYRVEGSGDLTVRPVNIRIEY